MRVLNEYTGDGVTTTFNFSMVGGYLNRDYIKFQTRLNSDLLGYTPYTGTVTWVGDYTVTVSDPIPVGTTFVIARETPLEPLVDFQNTSRITEHNLDTATWQSLHRTGEIEDFVRRSVVAIDTSAVSAAASANAAAQSAASAQEAASGSQQLAASSAASAAEAVSVAADATATAENALGLIEDATRGNVSSFNGRYGPVVPLSGDYTPAMVGLGDVLPRLGQLEQDTSLTLGGALTQASGWPVVPSLPASTDAAALSRNAQASALAARTEHLKQALADAARSVNGALRLDAPEFGFVGDGVADDTAAFIAAEAAAFAAGVPLAVPAGVTIKLRGSQSISFRVSADFQGASIDLTEFSGTLYFDRDEAPVVYPASHRVVTSITGTLTGSSIPGWLGVPEVNDSFVVVNTNAPHYSYRGAVVNRKEFNVHSRDGALDSSLRYPLAASAVTSVEVHKLPRAWTTVENVVFIVSGSVGFIPVVIRRSMFVQRNWRYVQADGFLTVNQTCLTVNDAAFVYGDRCMYMWPGKLTPSAYTYNLTLGNAYGVYLSGYRGQGDGWGATGSNDCQRVFFDKCSLSRIDFHNPFRELLCVKDSTVGMWGILVTALGDLVVDNVDFLTTTRIAQKNPGVIRSRNDTGGFCDGNLIITNSRIDNRYNSSLYVVAQSPVTPGNPKPAGSPVDYTFWKSVILDNVALSGLRAYAAVSIADPASATLPATVTVQNCTGPWSVFKDLRAGMQHASGVTKLAYINSSISAFSIVGAGVGYSADVLIQHNTHPRAAFENSARGTTNIIGSTIDGVDLYAGGAGTGSVINLYGTVVDHNGANNPLLVNTAGPDVVVNFFGCVVKATSLSALDNLHAFTLVGCALYVAGVRKLRHTVANFSSATSVAIRAPAPSPSAKFVAVTGLSSDGSAGETTVSLNTGGFKALVPTTTGVESVFYNNANGALEVSSLNVRSVQLIV